MLRAPYATNRNNLGYYGRTAPLSTLACALGLTFRRSLLSFAAEPPAPIPFGELNHQMILARFRDACLGLPIFEYTCLRHAQAVTLLAFST